MAVSSLEWSATKSRLGQGRRGSAVVSDGPRATGGTFKGVCGRSPPHVHAVERASTNRVAQHLQRFGGNGPDFGRRLHAPRKAALEVIVALWRGEAPEAPEHAPKVEERLRLVRRQPRAELFLGRAEVEARSQQRLKAPVLRDDSARQLAGGPRDASGKGGVTR